MITKSRKQLVIKYFHLFSWVVVSCGSSEYFGKSSATLSSQKSPHLSRQAKNTLAQTVVRAAAVPIQDAVVWTRDDNETIHSYWLRGNELGIDLAVARPGWVFPEGDALWELKETSREVQLCDCAAWENQLYEGDCPLLEHGSENVVITLFDRLQGTELELFDVPFQDDLTLEDGLSEYSASIALLASVGSLLFFRQEERVKSCSSTDQRTTAQVLIYDLDKRQFSDILTPHTLGASFETAYQNAVEQFNAEEFAHLDSDAIRFIGALPSYDPSFTLSLHFNFQADQTIEHPSSSSRSSFSSERQISAVNMPRELAPFSLPPAAVRIFAINTPELTHCGWTVVTGDDQFRSRLFYAFITE